MKKPKTKRDTKATPKPPKAAPRSPARAVPGGTNIFVGGAAPAELRGEVAEPVEDQFEGLTGEDRERAIADAQFWSSLAGEGGCRVYKINARTRKPEYVGNFPKDQIRNDVGFIGREYGGGDYHFEPANAKGQFMTRVPFSYSTVEYPLKDGENPPAYDPSMYAPPAEERITAKDLVGMMTEFAKANAGQGLSAKDLIPLMVNKGGDFTEKMALMLMEKMLNAPTGAAGVGETEPRPFMERMVESMMPHLGPHLASGLARMAAPPAPAPAPASTNPPVAQNSQPKTVAPSAGANPPGGGAASSNVVEGKVVPDSVAAAGVRVVPIMPSVAPAGGNGKMPDPVADELKPWLAMLPEYAANGTPVHVAASFIIRAFESRGKEWVLDGLVAKTDPLAFLLELEPALAVHREWLSQLIDRLKPVEEPEPEKQPAGVGPVSEQDIPLKPEGE